MNAPEVPRTFAPPWLVIAAIVLNFVPIAGVLFWGWSAFALVFLYWLENIVVGGRTFVSMLASGFADTARTALPLTLFLSGFFLFHYGLFCFGHGVFVTLFFGTAQGVAAASGNSPLDLVAVTRAMFAAVPGLTSGFISIVIWQTLLLVLFLIGGGFRRATPIELMTAPYPRIFILHFAIIGGAALVLALHLAIGGLVVLAVMKTLFDVAQARGVRR